MRACTRSPARITEPVITASTHVAADPELKELARIEALLSEHRDREANLRHALLAVQKVADEVRENAKREAPIIVREAQGRADLLLQKSQVNREELERAINELRMKRGDVEMSLEASIAALRHALEFIREQDQPQRHDKVRLHRPRQTARERRVQPHPQWWPATDRRKDKPRRLPAAPPGPNCTFAIRQPARSSPYE